MDVAVLVARIAAVVYLSAAVGALRNRSLYRRIWDDLAKNPALIYLAGFIALILGALIVHSHNTWTRDWTTGVTALGWLALLKGILLIAFPQAVMRASRTFMAGRCARLFPALAAVIGLVFGYFGFRP
jgi:hypothetical protein